MPNSDQFPEHSSYDALPESDAPSASAQTPSSESDFLYPNTDELVDFPDFELDELFLRLIRAEEESPAADNPVEAVKSAEPADAPTDNVIPTAPWEEDFDLDELAALRDSLDLGNAEPPAPPDEPYLPDEDPIATPAPAQSADAYEARLSLEPDDSAAASAYDSLYAILSANLGTDEPEYDNGVPDHPEDTSDEPEDTFSNHDHDAPPTEDYDEDFGDEPPADAYDEDGDDDEPESRFIRRVAERDARRMADSVPLDSDAPASRRAARELQTGKTPRQRSAIGEKLRAPFVRYFATLTAKKELREREAAAWPAPVPLRETPELPPTKAMHYYRSQRNTTTLRLIIALALTLCSMWIGFGFPMAGQLGRNTGLQAAVSLCLMLTTMLAALDVVTVGLRQLFRFHFGLEALAVLSAGLTALDALLVMLGVTDTLPYCSVATVSLTVALWGERLFCVASGINFGTAAGAAGSSILTLEEDKENHLRAVCLLDRSYEGIVRRSEDPDISRRAYSIAAPCLAATALLLALLGSLGGDWLGLPHRLSAYVAATCAFPAFLCFVLPYLSVLGRLRHVGAAIAGWSGCADLGRNRRMLVTDNDIFPPGSVTIFDGHMAEDDTGWQDRIAGYTVSMLSAAGCSCLHAFDELIKRRKLTIEPVEDLTYHDGGGLSGYIHNENVCIGSAGFLTLNGIRPLREVKKENGICVAVGGKFVAVITLSYTPFKGTQQALRLLSRGRTQPVFAIRDFNINPRMIQDLFGIPALNFEFPSFKERFRLSSDIGKPDTPAAAVLAHHSLYSAVVCTERCRRLYNATILNTVLSIAGSALTMALMFLSAFIGEALLPGVGRLICYMLLWLLPCFVSSYWVRR